MGEWFCIFKFCTFPYYEENCSFYRQSNQTAIVTSSYKNTHLNKEDIGPTFPGAKGNFSLIFNHKIAHELLNVWNMVANPLESSLNFVCNATGSDVQLAVLQLSI